ncbi:hypothetical protein JCM15519_37010 [Fundidesulfovibrio butyratiphilus]
MFSFFGKCREKDINSSSLGKTRTYKLARGETFFVFTGRLLAYYNVAADCLEPEAQNKTHLQSIALFKTRTRYLIHYVLHYENNEHIEGKVVHVHATDDLDGADKFLSAMTYANKRAFYPDIIQDAREQDGQA